jgi:hypothetical protein
MKESALSIYFFDKTDHFVSDHKIDVNSFIEILEYFKELRDKIKFLSHGSTISHSLITSVSLSLSLTKIKKITKICFKRKKIY